MIRDAHYAILRTMQCTTCAFRVITWLIDNDVNFLTFCTLFYILLSLMIHETQSGKDQLICKMLSKKKKERKKKMLNLSLCLR